RYAAGDLPPDEVAAFEARLAEDQEARDALAEAVRLSAQAIGQKPPTPHPSFRAVIRARLGLGTYRGHPLALAALGAAALAAWLLIGLSLATHGEAPEARSATPALPTPTEAIPGPRAIERAPAPAPAPREAGGVIATEFPAPATCSGDPPRSVAEIWADLSTP